MPDEIKARCGCASCRMRSLMAPILLITVGVIFLCGQYTRYGFGDLWPVILVVAGVVMIAQNMASREGHTN
jgi:Domain of unknown function (DUF5668)